MTTTLPIILAASLQVLGSGIEQVRALDSDGSTPPMGSTLYNEEASNDAGGNRLLVTFEKTLSTAEIEAIVQRLGGKIINRMLDGTVVLVEIPYPAIRQQIIDAYSATEGVIHAEPDHPVSIPEQSREQPNPQSGQGGATHDAPPIELPQIK
ncbi:hypothetical protein GOB20_09115 [Sinorhizobium meliloti]|nr:hypothetical protein [Sinorhizobium meliloti]